MAKRNAVKGLDVRGWLPPRRRIARAVGGVASLARSEIRGRVVWQSWMFFKYTSSFHFALFAGRRDPPP
jgi:hypothetical protein